MPPISFHKWVRNEDVSEWEAVGWIRTTNLDNTHHGVHAVHMIWPLVEEPRIPEKLKRPID